MTYGYTLYLYPDDKAYHKKEMPNANRKEIQDDLEEINQ